MKDTANSPDSYTHFFLLSFILAVVVVVLVTAGSATAAAAVVVVKSFRLVVKFICLHVVAPIDLHVCSRFRVAT